MRHHQTIAENQKMLRRVVAVLLALADLAERAAGRSRCICALVLWLLRPGEAIAQAYLDRLATGRLAGFVPVMPPRPDAPDACDGTADALHLAQVFRSLAAALAAFLDDDAAGRAAPCLASALRALSALPMHAVHAEAAVGRRDSS